MNTEPSWDLYRTFLAVMTERSLSAAARSLGLTQPTVARHIDALEQVCRASLFLRSQRGLSPTEMALALQPYAESLAAASAAFLRTASGRTGEVRGSVRVTASEMVGAEHLPPILAGLRRQHPGLVIELVLSNTIDNLLAQEADIAVRMVAPSQDALIARRLPPIALGLHAHRSYLKRHGTPQAVADLARHDLIGFDRETATIRAMRQDLERQASGADLSALLDGSGFALRTDSDLAQLAGIRAGCGIGICQVPIARRDRNLVRVLPDTFSLELGMWVVMHESLKTSLRCRTVFDALVDGLKKL